MSFHTFTDAAIIIFTIFIDMMSPASFTEFTIPKFIEQADDWSSHFSEIIFGSNLMFIRCWLLERKKATEGKTKSGYLNIFKFLFFRYRPNFFHVILILTTLKLSFSNNKFRTWVAKFATIQKMSFEYQNLLSHVYFIK